MIESNNCPNLSTDTLNCNVLLEQNVEPKNGKKLSVYEMASRFCAPLKFSESHPQLSVKACTCVSGECPLHGPQGEDNESQKTVRVVRPVSKNSRHNFRPQSHSSTAVKQAKSIMTIAERDDDELKLSLTSLSTSVSCTATDVSRQGFSSEENEATFQKWLAEKNYSKKRLEQERQLIEEAILKEKQKKMEMERKNYVNWLAAKKAEEKRKKMEEERKAKAEVAEKEEKEKKQLEKELKYQLWLKKKEEEYLETKLKEQMIKLRAAEDRKKRIEMNCAAYEEWLKRSRNKPKPLPLNRGLESLRASVSVSYVNPTPWEPNINYKTTTQ